MSSYVVPTVRLVTRPISGLLWLVQVAFTLAGWVSLLSVIWIPPHHSTAAGWAVCDAFALCFVAVCVRRLRVWAWAL